MRAPVERTAHENKRCVRRYRRSGTRAGDRQIRCAQGSPAGLARCDLEKRLQAGAFCGRLKTSNAERSIPNIEFRICLQHWMFGVGRSMFAYLTAGCCWVRQWNVPRPQINSRQSIPMTRRSGNNCCNVATAGSSFGSAKVGTSTQLFAM